MLPRNQRQEALSRAYVRAIAAQAGVICTALETDFGFDLLLRAVILAGQQYWDGGAQVEVQLKSTTRAAMQETSLVYDLEVRAYDLLRQVRVGRPRILVLVVLPEEESQWLTQSEDDLILRRCAYWMSFRGAATTASHTTVRIAVPRANVFSVESLQRMMAEEIQESTS